jgi:hypothetical protein
MVTAQGERSMATKAMTIRALCMGPHFCRLGLKIPC